MWHIFIRTLIEPGLFFNIVNTRTKNKIIVSWARATFKAAMCELAKTTKNDIVRMLMGRDIEKLVMKKIERIRNGKLELNMKGL